MFALQWYRVWRREQNTGCFIMEKRDIGKSLIWHISQSLYKNRRKKGYKSWSFIQTQHCSKKKKLFKVNSFSALRAPTSISPPLQIPEERLQHSRLQYVCRCLSHVSLHRVSRCENCHLNRHTGYSEEQHSIDAVATNTTRNYADNLHCGEQTRHNHVTTVTE